MNINRLKKKFVQFYHLPNNYKLFKIYGKLRHFIEPSFSVIPYLLKYRKHQIGKRCREGFSDHRGEIPTNESEERAIIDRLIKSYRATKSDQPEATLPYQVGAMYQRRIDSLFGDLSGAMNDGDSAGVGNLLQNFQRERWVSGLGSSCSDYDQMRKNPLYKYQYINTWCRYLRTLNELTNGVTPLSFSPVGNPAGITCDGQIIYLESLRFHYWSQRMFSLLKDVESPVICEIGSGVGGQAYKILENPDKNITYIQIDIPEVLIVSSYFLMRALPNKKTLLYGEKKLDGSALEEYDIICMPNFAMPNLPPNSVDLFFNDCSFTEMDEHAVVEYFEQIERIGRKYFLHCNHTAQFVWNDNGVITRNLPSDQISPSEEKFKKIHQYNRPFARLEDHVFYRLMKAKHYEYLYEKIEL